MPDPYVPLPAEDESVDTLLQDAQDTLADLIPGWAPSDGALEVALMAADAEEGSTLYALLREDADDVFRDYGQTVLGVTPIDPTPARTTTTWTARDTTGYTIDAGTTLVIDSASGRLAFETSTDTTIAPGDTTATGVEIQAIDPGSGANGATGQVLFDAQPSWLASVTVDTPAIGGTDGDDDSTFLQKVRDEARLLSRAPILPDDFAALGPKIAGIARVLVRDTYDDTTDTDDQDRTISLYPVDENGQAVSTGAKNSYQALIEARREVNWIVRVADPTYTTIDVDLTVAARAGTDHTDLAAAVQASVEEALNPATWGLPPSGEGSSWEIKRPVSRYEVAAAADRTPGVAYVDFTTVELNAGTVDLSISGHAPLPTPGTITITVIDP